MRLGLVCLDTWPAVTRVLSQSRERTLGTRLAKFQYVLHHYLQRYSLLCVLTSILSHLMTSSVPNLHNTKILNISGTRWDMTKRKTAFLSLFKAFQICLFFNTSIFHYIDHSICLIKIWHDLHITCLISIFRLFWYWFKTSNKLF